MARRKQSELGDIATRDRILNSARKYFLEYGFQAAPLRKIAMDAGFTSGALYGYFDSKEALFYAITDPIAESLMKKLNEIREEMDAIPDKYRLKRMGSAYYHHIPEIVEILLSDRDAVKLIVTGSKGTKYEAFVETIASRNTANIENAVLNGENKLETLYFGRISGLDPLYNEDWRRGYVCRRFVDGVSAEYEQYKGYLSAAYDIVLKDVDLLAAMPRDGAALTIYRRTEDDAELCVMDMLQRGGKKALYLFESAASIEEFDKFIYDAIVGIQQKNYACEYLTDRISWVMTDYGDVTELELTVDYTEGTVPLGKMAEAVDKRSLYEAMVEAWSTDIEKEAAVLYTGASMTEGEFWIF